MDIKERELELSRKLMEAFGLDSSNFLQYEGLFQVTKLLPCTLSLTPERHYTVQKASKITKDTLVKLSKERQYRLQPWGYSNYVLLDIHNPQIFSLEPISVKLEDFIASVIKR